jgi:hypothetical protein
MNIFVTSACPKKSAAALDDKRVVKMVLESAQMLSTAINEHGGVAPYKSTHKNHPANVWARTTRSNYMWLYAHFKALCEEYTNRYGKVHKCESYVMDFKRLAIHIPEGTITMFANCAANASIGISYKDDTDVFQAYRKYLSARWQTDKRKPTWKNNTEPAWRQI